MNPKVAERIDGIEHPLPDGERVRWQGRPRAALLAVHAFHVRAVLVYFLVIVALWSVRYAGELAKAQWITMFTAQLALAGIVVVAIYLLSWLVARTSVYAITDRRVVVHTGIAFPMTINVPLKVIESAALKRFRDGSGEIALTLEAGDRVAFLALWPHARPRHFKVPQPLLRALPKSEEVGQILQQAVHEFAEREGLPLPSSNVDIDATPRSALAHDPAVV